MQINNIVNQNFGKLLYPATAKKAVMAAINDTIRMDHRNMVEKMSNTFVNSETKNIDKYIANLQKAKNSYSNRINTVLKEFGEAVSLSAQKNSSAPKLTIKYDNKTSKLLATCENTLKQKFTFVYGKNSNIFSFLKNVTKAVL